MNRDHPIDRMYLEFLDGIETLVTRAHQRLGMFETSKRLQEALDVARAEVHRAIPDVITGRFTIGPVSEQPLTRKETR